MYFHTPNHNVLHFDLLELINKVLRKYYVRKVESNHWAAKPLQV
jgi:hypothetical protein